MKVIHIAAALIFGLASASAFACPKGTHLVGGTGPHHKGGKCVAADAADAKADSKAEKKADAKADAKADDKAAKKEAKKSKKQKKADAAK